MFGVAMATIHVLVCDLFSVLQSWVLVLLDLAFHVLFSPHSLGIHRECWPRNGTILIER
jgi:hypothetical protein